MPAWRARDAAAADDVRDAYAMRIYTSPETKGFVPADSGRYIPEDSKSHSTRGDDDDDDNEAVLTSSPTATLTREEQKRARARACRGREGERLGYF